MLKLPVYRRVNTYYFHVRLGGKQYKKSLHTGDEFTAKLRAIEFLKVIEVNKPTLSNFNINLSTLKKYELDLARGIAKSDGPEDHKRMLQAMKMMAKISQVPATSLPPEHFVTSATSGTLIELVDRFFSLKSTLSDATKTDYKATAKEFTDHFKNPALENITDDDITIYMEWLAKKSNSPRTIDKKVGCIRSLFNFAIKQKIFKGVNPASDRNLLTKKQKKGAGSKAYDLADVKQLFDNDTFRDFKTTDPAFFWISVIGLITGVRVSAIASLKKENLKIACGVHFIDIQDDKTPAGIRPVPIPEKIFPQFFLFLRNNDGFGFTKRQDGKGSSDPVRKSQNEYKQQIGYVGKKQTFSSFRKTLNTYLMHKKVPIEARCQFIGHELDHVNVAVYGADYSLEELAKMIVPHQEELLKLINQ
jgi:integrase